MTKNVRLFKLANGDDIIAEQVRGSADSITLKNIVKVVIVPPQRGAPQQQGISVGFAPWSEFAEDIEISLDRSHIVAIMTPIKMLVTQYNSMFSGILAPQPGLILP